VRFKGGTVTILAFVCTIGCAIGAEAQSVAIITSPDKGAIVSRQVHVSTQESNTVSWVNVRADGQWFASNEPNGLRPFSVTWDSTRVANGTHTLSVESYDSNDRFLGSNAITVQVANFNSGIVDPTAVATTKPTAMPTTKSTPVPTGKATPTPAGRASTAKPTVRPSATPTPVSISGAYYVAPNGSDGAAGTASAPWRTIQHAVSRLTAGRTAVVAAGNYVERVSINSSGSAAAPITLQVAAGASVKLMGFNLSGSYWVIKGFDISTQANDSDGYGIYVYGSASHDTIENNYIHELCHEGIYMEPTVSYISALNNRIWKAEMAGMQVDGQHDLIEGNEVWATQQWPSKLGGIYSGCRSSGGSDADAFRFFGQHHDFVQNYIHDIVYGTTENPNPHIDCFQTWGSGAMKVDDVTFERNRCRWPAATSSTDDETASIEGLEGAVGTLTFRNNVFANMRQGINVGANVAALRVWNNTWDRILEEAIIFSNSRSAADQIINNIFFDVGRGGDSYLCSAGGNPTIQDNDFFMRGGASPGNYCSSAPYTSVNPLFVNAGDSTGNGADYHLQSSSPVKDNGANMSSNVPNDYDGTARPIGAGYSLGAFER
jgi:Bacterial Ig domain/Right handed beta helix region